MKLDRLIEDLEAPPSGEMWCSHDGLMPRASRALKLAQIALTELSTLGSGTNVGNSYGNRIAQDALKRMDKI